MCLIGIVWILGFYSELTVAQTVDAERAERIREQMGATGRKMVNEADLVTLRQDLNKAITAIVSRINTLEKDMVEMKSRIRVLETRTAPAGAMLSDPVSPASTSAAQKTGAVKMNVSMCASGCDAEKFAYAVAMLNDGGTLTVKPGVYFDCIIIKKSMKLIGEIAPDGSRAHLKKIACSGKSAIDLQAPNVEIHGLQISEITVPDENGACIRIGPTTKTLLIRDIICLDSENGLLGAPNNEDGILTIEDSTFSGHGKNGQAHGLYINGGSQAILRNVTILSSDNGHLLKTGAKSMLVENSVIAALGGNSGAAVNAYAGGKLTIRNSVLQLSTNTQNHNFIYYANEPGRIVPGGAHEILIEKNWIIFDDPARCCRWLFGNGTNILDTVIIQDNKFVGSITSNYESVNMADNKAFADRAEAGLQEYDGMLASLPKPGS